MGVPTHFGSSIIQRTLQLLNDLEPEVEKRTNPEFGGALTTTFLLALAMPLLVIPTERYLRAKWGRPQHEGGISDRIRRKMLAELNKPFKKTAFYSGTSWAEARHPVPFVHPLGWAETFHHQLFGGIGAKRAQEAPAIDLVTNLRHALAHGAIAYLDADGRGIVGNTANRIAFISATNLDKKRRPKEYSVMTVREVEFSVFLRNWARWLLNVGADRGIALEKPV